ncbi:MAG: 1-deoxy-D-xylulose-5-phosphate reductoisomerase [Eubacteriales bacterium]
MAKKIAVLGATGTLGKLALEVIRKNDDKFKATVLTANKNVELVAKQAKEFKPEVVCLTGVKENSEIKAMFEKGTTLLFGEDSLREVCEKSLCDMAFIAVVGICGLPALVRCIQNDISIALANKESFVCGGKVIRSMIDKNKANVIPVDSELSAIFQCLCSKYDTKDLKRIILTASGGPFRTFKKARIYNATVSEALNHPNWSMGKKITVDSATMMNKGLEVMETRWLFNVEPEKIEVIIHPQSIIHSMVEYINASVMAQMSATSMTLPIQYAFSYPDRLGAQVESLDFKKLGSLSFEAPDFNRFPSIKLAYDALDAGTAACVALNAANEVAVEMFLQGKIPLGKIYELTNESTEKFAAKTCDSIEDISYIDSLARKFIENTYGSNTLKNYRF